MSDIATIEITSHASALGYHGFSEMAQHGGSWRVRRGRLEHLGLEVAQRKRRQLEHDGLRLSCILERYEGSVTTVRNHQPGVAYPKTCEQHGREQLDMAVVY